MFSYRHAFHAGNHADVLKHTVLIAALQYLTEKDAALTVLDTHAGAGLYRLDGDYAKTSAEAADGILRLAAASASTPLTPALQAYLELVRSFNTGHSTKVYPGSPFIIQHLLRAHDKLKLFELHPSDMRSLAGRPGRLRSPSAFSVSLLDLTVSVAWSQLLPALVANVLSRRGRSCASGRGMMGYQTA